MRSILSGSTNNSVTLTILDSTTFLPDQTVLYNDAGMSLWYRQDVDAATTPKALVTITAASLASLTTAHTDGGFLHIDDGEYRLDVPDAAFTGTGVKGVFIGGTVTGNLIIPVYVPIVQYDASDSVRLGLTSLPNAAADAAGGLPISDAGGLDLDAILADTNELQTDDIPGALATIAGYLDTEIAAILADTNELQTNQGNWVTATGFATPTNITAGTITTVSGNVAGSVGSVTGAVTVGTNNDKTGYTASTVTDKTGYSLAATGLDAIVSTATGMVEIAKAVWDRILTGATHNIPGSGGRRMREITSIIIRFDTAQGPGTGNNQIQLDAGASAVSGAYDPSIISIVGGTGIGQTRQVFEYDGASKTITVDRDWKVNPDATSEYIIVGDAGREHVNEGLITAATANTVTLNANASAIDNAYVEQVVFIRSGTGQDQARAIVSYDGTTKVATVYPAWVTNPSTDSGYAILPLQVFTLSDLSSAVSSIVDDLAIKKNTAFSNFEFLMVLTSDHVTPATGLTVTGQRSIDGGAFASVTGAIAEVSNGIYQFDALAADTNGDVITWRFSSATADDAFITFKTVA